MPGHSAARTGGDLTAVLSWGEHVLKPEAPQPGTVIGEDPVTNQPIGGGTAQPLLVQVRGHNEAGSSVLKESGGWDQLLLPRQHRWERSPFSLPPC